MELKIIPERDHMIHQNEVHIRLEHGVEVAVPERFIQALLTEGVISRRQVEAAKKQAQPTKAGNTKTTASGPADGETTEQ